MSSRRNISLKSEKDLFPQSFPPTTRLELESLNDSLSAGRRVQFDRETATPTLACLDLRKLDATVAAFDRTFPWADFNTASKSP